MDSRVVENHPLPPMTFHPVFLSLIEHADKYSLTYEETDKGMRVTYQSDDPYVVRVVQEHAKLVSRFVKNGHEDLHAEYLLPKFDEHTALAQAKALSARATLFKKLSGRLTQVMQQKGPSAAIEVCSKEAGQIALQVSDDLNVRIGRTSTRLRNHKNTPPECTKPLITKGAMEAEFVDLPNDRLGALLTIHLKSKCVTCHGPEDKLATDVKTRLAEIYPNDRATGFNEGDLRGWFWVEVPKKI